MDACYRIDDTSKIFSPALLFYKELIVKNIELAVRMAGSASRLRPHAKTHKTREIIELELKAGITKHKCATIAEAEMLASTGVAEIFLAYNMVGPNCARLAELAMKFPQVRFAVTADDAQALEDLSKVLDAQGVTVDVLLDLDVGQHRTGMLPGAAAERLYERICSLPSIKPGGFHVYDGHQHQEDAAERKTAVLRALEPVLELRAALERRSLPVPRVICGGTPTFPIYAALDFPGLELAPGTFVLHDSGYGSRFNDLKGFTPAALLLTRVISKPTATRVTMDLGYKALASDPPAGKRCKLLDVPDYEAVLQNEEHFVIETPAAAHYRPGDVIYAVPTHVCPTVHVHREALVVENGRVTQKWEIVGRDRRLTI
jgi:D-serine deaminase-like pyridoxal phosphate-dependent protein